VEEADGIAARGGFIRFAGAPSGPLDLAVDVVNVATVDYTRIRTTEFVFADGFESGDTSAWSASQTRSQ